jgi:hypothetical protein
MRFAGLDRIESSPADRPLSPATLGTPTFPKTDRHAEGQAMATKKQTQAARKNVRKAAKAARQKHTLASMPKATKTVLGKQGAAVAQRKRTGASKPKTRQELYDIAKRRNIKGRSKMGRDELARALGAE